MPRRTDRTGPQSRRPSGRSGGGGASTFAWLLPVAMTAVTVAAVAFLWQRRDTTALARERAAATLEAKVESAARLAEAGRTGAARDLYAEALALAQATPGAEAVAGRLRENLAALAPAESPVAVAPPVVAPAPPPAEVVAAEPEPPPPPPAEVASGSRVFDLNPGRAKPAEDEDEAEGEVVPAPPPEPRLAGGAVPPPPPAEVPVEIPPAPAAVELAGPARALALPAGPIDAEAQGGAWRLLCDGDAPAAALAAVREFRDDVTDPHPAHVAAIAFHLAGKDAQARTWADRALGRAAAPPPGLALNAASLHLPSSPMRSATLLLDAADALERSGDAAGASKLTAAAGTALQAAWADDAVSDALFESLDRMIAADERLAGAVGRDGQGRFGSQWLPVEESRHRWAALAEARRVAAAAAHAVDDAREEHERLAEIAAKAAAYERRLPGRSRAVDDRARRAARARDAAADVVRDAQEALAAARRGLAAVEKPSWPESIPLTLPARPAKAGGG